MNITTLEQLRNALTLMLDLASDTPVDEIIQAVARARTAEVDVNKSEALIEKYQLEQASK